MPSFSPQDVVELLGAVAEGRDRSSGHVSSTLPAKVLIRTVTHYHVGRVVDVTPDWIVLDEASWVPSTGRFHTALDTGTLDEVEPFVGRVWVARGSVVDLTEWTADLPRSVQ